MSTIEIIEIFSDDDDDERPSQAASRPVCNEPAVNYPPPLRPQQRLGPLDRNHHPHLAALYNRPHPRTARAGQTSAQVTAPTTPARQGDILPSAIQAHQGPISPPPLRRRLPPIQPPRHSLFSEPGYYSLPSGPVQSAGHSLPLPAQPYAHHQARAPTQQHLSLASAALSRFAAGSDPVRDAFQRPRDGGVATTATAGGGGGGGDLAHGRPRPTQSQQQHKKSVRPEHVLRADPNSSAWLSAMATANSNGLSSGPLDIKNETQKMALKLAHSRHEPSQTLGGATTPTSPETRLVMRSASRNASSPGGAGGGSRQFSVPNGGQSPVGGAPGRSPAARGHQVSAPKADVGQVLRGESAQVPTAKMKAGPVPAGKATTAPAPAPAPKEMGSPASSVEAGPASRVGEASGAMSGGGSSGSSSSGGGGSSGGSSIHSAIKPPAPPSTVTSASGPLSATTSATFVLATPARPPPLSQDFSVASITSRLRQLANDLRRDHAEFMNCENRLEILFLEDNQRHISRTNLWAGVQQNTAEGSPKDTAHAKKIRMKQHGAQHGKTRTEQRLHLFCRAKTDKKAVPKYRFHHVEISKNILSANSMLKFIPHLRDMEAGEEKIFNSWVSELQDMDRQSGLMSLVHGARAAKTKRDELAAFLSEYLERWLGVLAISGCTKTALIRYMASQTQEEEASFTPQQKHSLLHSYRNQEAASPAAAIAAKAFTEAYNDVFGAGMLTDVLSLDESVEQATETKSRAKETPGVHKTQSLIDEVEEALTNYMTLGCLICFSHSCEHGEYLQSNHRKAFSAELCGGLLPMLKDRRIKYLREREKQRQAQQQQQQQRASLAPNPSPRSKKNGVSSASASALTSSPQPCKNRCYMSYDIGNEGYEIKAWSDRAIQLLKTSFLVMGVSGIAPQCFVAVLTNRHCFEVHRKIRELDLKMPPELEMLDDPQLLPSKPVKQLSWYDRHKKVLIGDWKEHTNTHDPTKYVNHDPCHHDGPCSAANGCPCVELNVLCERFCRCTAETCAYKFTGCACQSLGKTCLGRQCICVQLDRECDPVLCGGCGARARADPENKDDEALHSTGCQNCELQRGRQKALCLGESQIENCGYGLYTAEDIAADEFVIEYVGEIISHDEGVRREARRGNVFDKASNSSYLFTLLEEEGIWIDAEVYGNLSRYINHMENSRRGCNLVPKIVWVNGEHRIRFTALRDIKAGEELFFNYGENFPNLTKKRLEDKADADEDDDLAAAAAGLSSSARFVGLGSDDDDDFDALLSAPAQRKKPGPKPKRRRPGTGKRGGARPGAGRKPNILKNAAGQLLTKTGEVRKKPGPKPKPRLTERKGAPPPTQRLATLPEESASATPLVATPDDDEEDPTDDYIPQSRRQDEDDEDNESSDENGEDQNTGGRQTLVSEAAKSVQIAAPTRAAGGTTRLRKRRHDGSEDDADYGSYSAKRKRPGEAGARRTGVVYNEDDDVDDVSGGDDDGRASDDSEEYPRLRPAAKRTRTAGPTGGDSSGAKVAGRRLQPAQRPNIRGRNIVLSSDKTDSDEQPLASRRPLGPTSAPGANVEHHGYPLRGGASARGAGAGSSALRTVVRDSMGEDADDTADEEDEEDEEEDETADSESDAGGDVDRSRRQTQRPARYRSGAE